MTARSRAADLNVDELATLFIVCLRPDMLYRASTNMEKLTRLGLIEVGPSKLVGRRHERRRSITEAGRRLLIAAIRIKS